MFFRRQNIHQFQILPAGLVGQGRIFDHWIPSVFGKQDVFSKLLSVHENLPRIRFQKAKNRLEDQTFTGPVRTNEAVNARFGNFKRNIVQSHKALHFFSYVFNFYDASHQKSPQIKSNCLILKPHQAMMISISNAAKTSPGKIAVPLTNINRPKNGIPSAKIVKTAMMTTSPSQITGEKISVRKAKHAKNKSRQNAAVHAKCREWCLVRTNSSKTFAPPTEKRFRTEQKRYLPRLMLATNG